MVIETEKMILAIPYTSCPFLNNTKVSKLKVEKVLKPPVNPMIKKKYQKFFDENKGSNLPNANPKTTHASTFAKKVPIGRSCLK